MSTSLDSTDLLGRLRPVAPNRASSPLLMGILNATPDSFARDGLHHDVAALVARGVAQAEAGAMILDVGGESSAPGSTPISVEEELQRVMPVIERLLKQVAAPISIDTVKAEVAEAALSAGARVLNDISGLRDERLAQVAARHGAWLVLMHNRWTAPASRDRLGGYYQQEASEDVVDEVANSLATLVDRARAAGVARERLIVDPGLGFGKSPRESLELLRRTGELHERFPHTPLLIGPSRKSFVGRALGLPVEERLEGTLACVAIAAFYGADVIRVHDVAPAARATRMAWAVARGRDAILVDAG